MAVGDDGESPPDARVAPSRRALQLRAAQKGVQAVRALGCVVLNQAAVGLEPVVGPERQQRIDVPEKDKNTVFQMTDFLKFSVCKMPS